jgi:hypothetical protein
MDERFVPIISFLFRIILVCVFFYGLSLIPTKGSTRKMIITKVILLAALAVMALFTMYYLMTW